MKEGGLCQVMEEEPQEPEISGILEKRRQNLKFHWRTYQFILKGANLSYFKRRGSDDKEGELWGTINLHNVTSLVSVDIMGSRYPIEVTLRNGKVILLAADSSTERGKWMKVLQQKMASIRKRRTSDTPVVREKVVDANRGICDWMRKSDPAGETRGLDCSEGADELGDLDSFIDHTFSGISFNRASQIKKVESQRSQDKDAVYAPDIGVYLQAGITLSSPGGSVGTLLDPYETGAIETATGCSPEGRWEEYMRNKQHISETEEYQMVPVTLTSIVKIHLLKTAPSVSPSTPS